MCGFGTAPSRPIVYGMEGCWKTSSMLARSTGRPAYMTRMSPTCAGHHAQIVGDEHDGGAGLLLRLGENVEDLRLNRHVEAVVGPSAMMTSGLFAMAMAIITR